jgi:hypothetical protein
MHWNINEYDLDGLKLTTSRIPNMSSVDTIVRMDAGAMDEYPHYPAGILHFLEHISGRNYFKFSA